MKKELKENLISVSKTVKNSNNIVIFGHVNPDGDAMGSTLGLYHYLKTTKTDVTVIVPNDFPVFLKWMPASEDVIVFESNKNEARKRINNADLMIICDFNDPKRCNGVTELINSSKCTKVMFDHHPQPIDFVDHMISDTSVSSTCELVFEYIKEVDGDKISGQEMAQCLLTGIITDTGLFNHNSETTRTFEIVSELLKLGADKSLIIKKLYNEYPITRMQLLGNTLHNRLHFFPEYGASYIYLSKEDQVNHKYQIGDSEGFVNIALSIQGANFAAIFIEKDDLVKTSFRSKGSFDVNQFARKHFNGGGHKNAAGGKSYTSLNKTLETFVNLLSEYKEQILKS